MRIILYTLLVLMTGQVLAAQQRPNVLLVVADDLGYTDLGSYGGEINTPNLDALATAGMRLSNFYTAPTCSPTRAMLMTGADNHLVGLGNMKEAMAPNQRGKLGYEGYLNQRAAFLPKAFADAGYRTSMTGKWHLGNEEEQSPAARGFAQSFVLSNSGAGHFSDLGVNSMHADFRENGKPAKLPENFYSSRFYTDKLIEYIDEGRVTGKPFFAYLAFTAPHWPLQASEESIAKYEGKYRKGYDRLHKARIDQAKELGVLSPEATPVPRQPGQPAWKDLTKERRKVEQRKMEIYAAMVDDMDAHFGRLIDYLKSTNQFENTIIFFMSDNGAEGSTVEREYPFFAKHVAACCDNSYDNMGKPDSYVMYGPNWARASVGGVRDYKGRTTEGGIKAPAFIYYPGMHNSGSISHRFSTVKDVLPTLMQLSDIQVPSGYEVPVEGRPIFSPQFGGGEMGWEFVGGKAYRKGDWKLVFKNKPHGGDNQWHLYNLSEDLGEQNDIRESNPKKYEELLQLYARYEKQNSIIYPKFK